MTQPLGTRLSAFLKRQLRPPLWAQVWFAFVVAIVLLVAAREALKGAVMSARMNVPEAARHPDTSRAVLFMILSMLLVVAAIVLPLVIRARANKRIQRQSPR